MDKAKYKDSHCLDGIASGLSVSNRGDTIQYTVWNADKLWRTTALIYADGGQ